MIGRKPHEQRIHLVVNCACGKGRASCAQSLEEMSHRASPRSAPRSLMERRAEAERSRAARLKNKPGEPDEGPGVTSCWSFMDQAYVIEDGNLDRQLFVPVWNQNSWTGRFVSPQQGTLSLITGYSPQGSTEFVSTTTAIDTQVQSFVVNLSGGVAQIFDLSSDGQVKQYSGSGTSWTSITDASTVASALVSTSNLAEQRRMCTAWRTARCSCWPTKRFGN